jgi:hypothetical protein
LISLWRNSCSAAQSSPAFAPLFQPPRQVVGWFAVELRDKSVRAFTTFPITLRSRSDGVVVRDGGSEGRAPAALQMVGCPKDFMLAENLNSQSNLGGNLAHTLLEERDVRRGSGAASRCRSTGARCSD